MVTNVDLTATIAEAAGVAWNRDGRSVLSSGRAGTVVEQIANGEHPAYCGWRTERYLFTQYDTGERELYDYRHDPAELRNRVDVARHASTVTRLQAKAEQACVPLPPGFAW